MARSPLDIIIVSYNCRDALDACLRSLWGPAQSWGPALAGPDRRPQSWGPASLGTEARAVRSPKGEGGPVHRSPEGEGGSAKVAAGPDTRIIVVDNASTDGTAAHLRAHWPRVDVMASDTNRGFAAANNLGIRASRAPLVLLLNPDTLVTAGAIDTLVAALEADPRAAVAGPRIVDGEGRAELSFGPMIGPFAELRQKLLVVGHDRRIAPIASLVERMTQRAQHPDWVSGACLLIRRHVLEAVGLLDERFFLYTEDVDLCAAVRARGHTILFAPQSSIVHLRGRSRVTAASATHAAYRRSQVAFYEKHHPRWAPVLKAYLRLRGEFPS
jgi:GT2 family glycosyltransferase